LLFYLFQLCLFVENLPEIVLNPMAFNGILALQESNVRKALMDGVAIEAIMEGLCLASKEGFNLPLGSLSAKEIDT
jgi:hypothetical protein